MKSPIDLEHFTAAGLLHKCDFEGQKIKLFVQMAIQLGDGEAACFAIAAKRGWTLATDDRPARRLAAESSLAVVTTPELVKVWAANTKASDEEIVAVSTFRGSHISRRGQTLPSMRGGQAFWAKPASNHGDRSKGTAHAEIPDSAGHNRAMDGPLARRPNVPHCSHCTGTEFRY